MNIEALISELEALIENLKSVETRESASFKDFEGKIERFEALLSDLIVLSNKPASEISQPLENILIEIQAKITEFDEFSNHQLKLLSFIDDIIPIK